jgi:hypothetical protein
MTKKLVFFRWKAAFAAMRRFGRACQKPCLPRHCEERSDEAIQQARAKVLQRGSTLDCFAATRNDEEERALWAMPPRVD